MTEQRRGKLIEGMAFTTPEEIVEWVYSQENNFREAEEKSKNDSNLRHWLMVVRTPERLEQIKKCKEYIATLENPPVYNPPPKKEEKPRNCEAEFWERMRAPLNPGSASPALTRTPSHERTVQWVQGNTIYMRPPSKEVRW